MATGVVTSELETRTVQTVTDLTDKNYFFANLSTVTDQLVALAADATKIPWILQDAPLGTASVPASASIAVNGVTKLKLGASAVAVGDRLTADSDGKGVPTTTSTNKYGAIAMENGAAGDIIAVRVAQGLIP